MFRARSFAVQRGQEIVRSSTRIGKESRRTMTASPACCLFRSRSFAASGSATATLVRHRGTGNVRTRLIGARPMLTGSGDANGGEGETCPERGKPVGTMDASLQHVTAQFMWQLKNLGKSTDVHRQDEALQLLEEGRQKGIIALTAYNAVLQALSGYASNDVMEKLLRQMQQDGITPNTNTYNYVIYGYAFNKDLPGALRTYKNMLSNGISRDFLTLSNLIIAHSWSSTEDMMRILEELRAEGGVPTRAAYHSIIPALGRANDWKGVYEVFRSMKMAGILANDAAFSIAFSAARKLNNPDFAKALLGVRNDWGALPKQNFFFNAMLTIQEAGRHEEVMEYWRQLVCIDGVNNIKIAPKTLLLALRSAVKIRAWDEVEVIISMVQVEGIPPKGGVYLELLKLCQKTTHPEDVERVVGMLAEFERRGGELPGLKHCLGLAVVYANAEMFDKAMPLFEVACLQPGVKRSMSSNAKVSLVKTLVHLKKFDEIKQVWIRSTYENKKSYIGIMYQRMMKVAKQTGDVDWALQLQATSLKNSTKTQKWYSSIPLMLLAKAGRLEEVGSLLKNLRKSRRYVKQSQNTYNALCRCCKEKGNAKVAVDIIQEMRSGHARLLPNQDVLAFVMEAFIEHGLADETITMFNEMRAKKLWPDPKYYVIVANAAVEVGDRAKVLECVANAKKYGLQTSARAAAFLRENGK